MIDNCNIVYENLPVKIKGFAMHDAADNFYTIVLNSKHSTNLLRETFKHELKHIIKEDFILSKDVNLIETNTH